MLNKSRRFVQLFFDLKIKKSLDYEGEYSYLTSQPKVARAHGCPPNPRIGEEIGKVPGINPSSRYSGQPENARTPEATTVRAFLFSPCFPSAGVTEEAHHHCRKCGWDSPSNPWQTKPNLHRVCGVGSLSAHRALAVVPGSPPAGSNASSRMPFVLRIMPELWNWKRELI
ncbi:MULTISPECIES: hypothetical protein [Rhizobium]|uniref:hypothetical protein n=1 Tax=Rhizobium TaxID=379 RepID=UPI001B32EB4B|nr:MULTISPECIES: hypothetical protein [Rhizobium]MBX4907624.1 hypothetical protein [Rhizobium bangladeshense]MBX5215387.1 hypothetical protein [Rhizobium sp. NLR9a]MBX5221206.1 hypothetical protein [Rhizobium sp. NLR8a]MBX5226663.1 hypothetical protein [Rhizobium sp. NLR9b]MBX5232553.1 hypothetical protein [Rhizobium sp. NLR4a]